jgi:hypothetical protein
VIGLLVALYPPGWRRRYGEEFRVVLESRPLGPFDIADVLLGALDARLAPRPNLAAARLHGGQHVMLRIGGLGGVAGGVLFFVGFAAASSFDGPDTPWIVVAALGTLGILAALVGLSAFQAYRDPRLAWAAFAIPALGSLVSVVGMGAMVLVQDADSPFIGEWTPWSIWFVGFLATVIGSILFGVATVRAAVLSRRAAQWLVGSAVAIIVVGLGGGIDAGEVLSRALAALSLGAFSLSWITLGATALRRGPIRAVAPA